MAGRMSLGGGALKDLSNSFSFTPTPKGNCGQQQQQQQSFSSVHKQSQSDRDRCLQLEAKLAGEQNKVRKLITELKAAKEPGGIQEPTSAAPTLAQQAAVDHTAALEAQLNDLTKERDLAAAEKNAAFKERADAFSAREWAQSAQARAEARMVEALAARDAASAAAAASEAWANTLVREAAAAAADKMNAASKGEVRVEALETALAKSNAAAKAAVADLAEARAGLAATAAKLYTAEALAAEQSELFATRGEEISLLSAALEGRDQEVQRLRERVRALEAARQEAADLAALQALAQQRAVQQAPQKHAAQQEVTPAAPVAFPAALAPAVEVAAEPALFPATLATEALATEALGATAAMLEKADDNDDSPLVLGAAAAALAAAADELHGGGHGGRKSRRRSTRLQRMSVGPLGESAPDATAAAVEAKTGGVAPPQVSMAAALAMTDAAMESLAVALAQVHEAADPEATPEAAPEAALSACGDVSEVAESKLGEVVFEQVTAASVRTGFPAAAAAEVEEEEVEPAAAVAAQTKKAKKAKGRRRRSGVFGERPKFTSGHDEDATAAVASEEFDLGDDWSGGLMHWGYGLPSPTAVAAEETADTVAAAEASAINVKAAPVLEAADDPFSPCKGAPPPSPGAARLSARPSPGTTVRARPILMTQVDEESDEASAVVAAPTAVAAAVPAAVAAESVPLSALTDASLAAALAAFSPSPVLGNAAADNATPASENTSTASGLAMAAACAAVGQNAAAALAPLAAALAAAERAVADGCAKAATSASTGGAAAGKRRVRFASHDFSAVAPPVDTAARSDAEADLCVAALAAALDAKQALRESAQHASLLQPVAAALAAVACALQQVPSAGAAETAAAGSAEGSNGPASVLRNACAARGLSARHVAANAALLAAELACSDAAPGSAAAVGPLRARLIALVSSHVRFHLRRLLNAPPPPATTPCLTQNTAQSYAEAGCRSNAHKLFRFAPPPPEVPPAGRKAAGKPAAAATAVGAATAAASTSTATAVAAATKAPSEGDCLFAEGAVASVVTQALEALHWADVADGPAEPCSTTETAAAALNAALAAASDAHDQDPTAALATVARAHAAAEGARAAAFLHTLFEWPGLEAAVARHGGWGPVETFAALAQKHGGGGRSTCVAHLAPLRDLAQLRLSVAPGGRWHRTSAALQPLRATLARLKHTHAHAIAAAVAADDAHAPEEPRRSAEGAAGRAASAGRRKRSGCEVPRSLLIALGADSARFPSLAHVALEDDLGE